MTREEAIGWLDFYKKKPSQHEDGRFAWFSTGPLTEHLPAELFGDLGVAGIYFVSEEAAVEWAINKLMQKPKGEQP